MHRRLLLFWRGHQRSGVGMSKSLSTGYNAPREQIKRVIQTICDEEGVTYAEVMGRSRYANIVRARHRAMVEVGRAMPWLSYPRIGQIFDRDHTSVLHAHWKLGAANSSRTVQNAWIRVYGRHAAPAMGVLFAAIADVFEAQQQFGMAAE